MPELIEAQGIQFSYPQYRQEHVPILVDFSLTIREGECFCLLGPSGCGKTTVLRMIAGFQFPDTGILTLQGHNITGPGVERGVVFQAITHCSIGLTRPTTSRSGYACAVSSATRVSKPLASSCGLSGSSVRIANIR